MPQLSRVAGCLLLSALAACGGKSFDTDPHPSTGGSGQSGSASGGSAQGGSGSGGASRGGSSATGGASAGGSAQGGSAGSCTAFVDEPSTLVHVAIINQTSSVIYLGQDMVTCGVSPLFDVTSAGADNALPRAGLCRQTCEEVIKSGGASCPGICAFPSTVALQPGAALRTSWDGMFVATRMLPSSCVRADFGVSSCEQLQQVEPGEFMFSARAGRSQDCTQTNGSACGECLPGSPGSGGCTTPGGLIAGETLSATTRVFLDASYGIYGSPRPAPAPALPNPGGDAGTAPEPLVVELVFSE